MEFFRRDNSVLTGRLESGLTYYIRKNATPRGMACIYLVKRVGSVMEEDSESGYAHFLEHMSFNGMEGFPGNDMIRSLEGIGVRFGDELNAYTNAEETVYTLKNVPSSKENIRLCLDILKGCLLGLTLSAEAIETEKGVILDEFRVTSSPMQRMFDRMQKEMYAGSPYADRPVLGTQESILALTRESLLRFYKKWSRPDLSAIIIVGDFDADEVESMVRSMDIPLSPETCPRPVYPIPANESPIILEEHDSEQEFPRAIIWIKRDVQPSWYIGSHEALLEDYIAEIAVRILNSRLQYIANGNDAPFLDAMVSLSDFILSSTSRVTEAVVDMQRGKFEDGLLSCLLELRRATLFGFTQQELDKARRGWMNSMKTSFNEREKRNSDSFCNEYMRNFTRLEPIPSIEDEYAFAMDVVPGIALSDVNDAVRGLLTGNGRIVAAFLPEGEMHDISAVISASESASIDKTDLRLPNGLVLEHFPTPGSVVSRQQSMYGYNRFVLDNGAEVYLKTTDFADDEILLKCFRYKGRKNYDLSNEGFALEYVAEVGGFGKYSRQDIYAMVEDRQFEIRPQCGALMFTLDCNSNCRDLETLLQMVHLYFTSRRKDDKSFEMWKERMRNKLLALQSDPVETVYRHSDTMMFPDFDKYVKISSDAVDAIDYDTAFSMADDMFSDASSFTFVFTGNITEDSLLPLVTKYLASLPSKYLDKKQTLSHLLSSGTQSDVIRRNLETPAAYSLTSMACYADPGIKNDITADLLGQILDMELHEKVREKEGDVYSVYSYGYLSTFLPCVAFLNIFFQSETSRADAIMETIDRILRSDFSAEKLTLCKQYMLKRHQNDLRANAYFQKKMASYLMSGYDTLTTFNDTLLSVGIEDLRLMLSAMTCRKSVLLLPLNPKL